MKFRTCLDFHLRNQSLNINFATSGYLNFVSLCSNTKEGLDKIRILRCSSSMDCTKHKDMGVVQIQLKLDQGALGMSDPCGTLHLALKPYSVSRINCLLSNFYFCAYWSIVPCQVAYRFPWGQGVAYRVPGGQGVGLEGPRGSRGRPTGSQGVKG